MNKTLLNTKPNKNAIATSQGWVDYQTKKLIVKIDNLKWRLFNEPEQIIETVVEDTIEKEDKDELIENKTKLGTKRNTNRQRLDGSDNE